MMEKGKYSSVESGKKEFYQKVVAFVDGAPKTLFVPLQAHTMQKDYNDEVKQARPAQHSPQVALSASQAGPRPQMPTGTISSPKNTNSPDNIFAAQGVASLMLQTMVVRMPYNMGPYKKGQPVVVPVHGLGYPPLPFQTPPTPPPAHSKIEFPPSVRTSVSCGQPPTPPAAHSNKFSDHFPATSMSPSISASETTQRSESSNDVYALLRNDILDSSLYKEQQTSGEKESRSSTGTKLIIPQYTPKYISNIETHADPNSLPSSLSNNQTSKLAPKPIDAKSLDVQIKHQKSLQEMIIRRRGGWQAHKPIRPQVVKPKVKKKRGRPRKQPLNEESEKLKSEVGPSQRRRNPTVADLLKLKVTLDTQNEDSLDDLKSQEICEDGLIHGELLQVRIARYNASQFVSIEEEIVKKPSVICIEPESADLYDDPVYFWDEESFDSEHFLRSGSFPKSNIDSANHTYHDTSPKNNSSPVEPSDPSHTVEDALQNENGKLDSPLRKNGIGIVQFDSVIESVIPKEEICQVNMSYSLDKNIFLKEKDDVSDYCVRKSDITNPRDVNLDAIANASNNKTTDADDIKEHSAISNCENYKDFAQCAYDCEKTVSGKQLVNNSSANLDKTNALNKALYIATDSESNPTKNDTISSGDTRQISKNNVDGFLCDVDRTRKDDIEDNAVTAAEAGMNTITCNVEEAEFKSSILNVDQVINKSINNTQELLRLPVLGDEAAAFAVSALHFLGCLGNPSVNQTLDQCDKTFDETIKTQDQNSSDSYLHKSAEFPKQTAYLKTNAKSSRNHIIVEKLSKAKKKTKSKRKMKRRKSQNINRVALNSTVSENLDHQINSPDKLKRRRNQLLKKEKVYIAEDIVSINRNDQLYDNKPDKNSFIKTEDNLDSVLLIRCEENSNNAKNQVSVVDDSGTDYIFQVADVIDKNNHDFEMKFDNSIKNVTYTDSDTDIDFDCTDNSINECAPPQVLNCSNCNSYENSTGSDLANVESSAHLLSNNSNGAAKERLADRIQDENHSLVCKTSMSKSKRKQIHKKAFTSKRCNLKKRDCAVMKSSRSIIKVSFDVNNKCAAGKREKRQTVKSCDPGAKRMVVAAKQIKRVPLLRNSDSIVRKYTFRQTATNNSVRLSTQRVDRLLRRLTFKRRQKKQGQKSQPRNKCEVTNNLNLLKQQSFVKPDIRSNDDGQRSKYKLRQSTVNNSKSLPLAEMRRRVHRQSVNDSRIVSNIDIKSMTVEDKVTNNSPCMSYLMTSKTTSTVNPGGIDMSDRIDKDPIKSPPDSLKDNHNNECVDSFDYVPGKISAHSKASKLGRWHRRLSITSDTDRDSDPEISFKKDESRVNLKSNIKQNNTNSTQVTQIVKGTKNKTKLQPGSNHFKSLCGKSIFQQCSKLQKSQKNLKIGLETRSKTLELLGGEKCHKRIEYSSEKSPSNESNGSQNNNAPGTISSCLKIKTKTREVHPKAEITDRTKAITLSRMRANDIRKSSILFHADDYKRRRHRNETVSSKSRDTRDGVKLSADNVLNGSSSVAADCYEFMDDNDETDNIPNYKSIQNKCDSSDIYGCKRVIDKLTSNETKLRRKSGCVDKSICKGKIKDNNLSVNIKNFNNVEFGSTSDPSSKNWQFRRRTGDRQYTDWYRNLKVGSNYLS